MPGEVSIGDWSSWDEGPSELPVSSRPREFCVSFMLSEVDWSLVAIGEKCVRIDSAIDVLTVFLAVLRFLGCRKFLTATIQGKRCSVLTGGLCSQWLFLFAGFLRLSTGFPCTLSARYILINAGQISSFSSQTVPVSALERTLGHWHDDCPLGVD